MVKVCVCGAAGGIGQPLSLLLKQSLPAGSELRLLDVVGALGVAADLGHVSTHVSVQGFISSEEVKNGGDASGSSGEVVTGMDAAMKDADLVVVPAGMPRKPGMTRADLFGANAGIVAGIAASIAKNCPNAVLCLITNPVNSMVPVAAEVLRKHGVYDKKRVFGVSTLDVVRGQTFIAALKKRDPAEFARLRVVGGHSAETMLPLLSQLDNVELDEEERAMLVRQIQEAGTVVVEAKAGAGSATLSMAYAGARFAMAVVRALGGEQGIVECAYLEVDERHGLPAQFFALPVELGTDGAHKIQKIGKLSDAEQAILDAAVPILQDNIKMGIEFGQSYGTKS